MLVHSKAPRKQLRTVPEQNALNLDDTVWDKDIGERFLWAGEKGIYRTNSAGSAAVKDLCASGVDDIADSASESNPLTKIVQSELHDGI